MEDHTTEPLIFLSYARRDAAELAERLAKDIELAGFRVFLDKQSVRSPDWETQIRDGIKSSQVVVALLSSGALRRADSHAPSAEDSDSVCLGELSFAFFEPPPARTPILPVMATECLPPLWLHHLNRIDMLRWQSSSDEYQDGLKLILESVRHVLQEGRAPLRPWIDKLIPELLQGRPLDFDEFLYRKSQGFIGREWLFDKIESWLTAERGGPALLITGDPGIGKSAIVAHLVHGGMRHQPLAYYCCRAESESTLRPGNFVRHLVAALAAQFPQYGHQLANESLLQKINLPNPVEAFYQGLLQPLQRLSEPASGTGYILIDALDECSLYRGRGPNIVDVLSTYIESLPPWLKLVATTRREPEVVRALSGLKAEPIDAHGGENLGDVEQYIVEYLNTPDMQESIAHQKIDAAALSTQLLDHSEGNFLYIQQLFEGVERGIYGLNELEKIPPGLTGLYDRFFSRVFADARGVVDDSGYAAAQTVLAILLASQEPLTRDLLQRASGLSLQDFGDVSRVLKSYLTSRDGTTTLYHRSLSDWLRDIENPFFADPKSGHAHLADLCRQVLNENDEVPPYVDRHAELHYRIAGGEFAKSLRDIDQLKQKAERAEQTEQLARRLSKQLEVASTLQSNLLPELGQAAGFEIGLILDPRDTVSGDYAIVETLPDGQLFVCLFDAIGHGVHAAIHGANIHGYISAQLQTDLLQLIAKTNKHSCRFEDRFVTLWCAVIDPTTGEISSVGAGVPSATIVNHQTGMRLANHDLYGIPLGIVDDYDYEIVRDQLEPGELLVLYTDGFFEGANAERDFLGVERLNQIAAESFAEDPAAPAARIAGRIRAKVDHWCGPEYALHDDRTLLLVKRRLD